MAAFGLTLDHVSCRQPNREGSMSVRFRSMIPCGLIAQDQQVCGAPAIARCSSCFVSICGEHEIVCSICLESTCSACPHACSPRPSQHASLAA